MRTYIKFHYNIFISVLNSLNSCSRRSSVIWSNLRRPRPLIMLQRQMIRKNSSSRKPFVTPRTSIESIRKAKFRDLGVLLSSPEPSPNSLQNILGNAIESLSESRRGFFYGGRSVWSERSLCGNGSPWSGRLLCDGSSLRGGRLRCGGGPMRRYCRDRSLRRNRSVCRDWLPRTSLLFDCCDRSLGNGYRHVLWCRCMLRYWCMLWCW